MMPTKMQRAIWVNDVLPEIHGFQQAAIEAEAVGGIGWPFVLRHQRVTKITGTKALVINTYGWPNDPPSMAPDRRYGSGLTGVPVYIDNNNKDLDAGDTAVLRDPASPSSGYLYRTDYRGHTDVSFLNESSSDPNIQLAGLAGKINNNVFYGMARYSVKFVGASGDSYDPLQSTRRWRTWMTFRYRPDLWTSDLTVNRDHLIQKPIIGTANFAEEF